MTSRPLAATSFLVWSFAQITVAHMPSPHEFALICTVLSALRQTPAHDCSRPRAGSGAAAAAAGSAIGASVSAAQASNRDRLDVITQLQTRPPPCCSCAIMMTAVRQSVALVRQLRYA